MKQENMKRKQRGFLNFLIPAAATLLGGYLGRDGQRETNETNTALSREQMAFQERMSSSAYQRATTDMQAAGLNPMLAYSQGGASAPMGSMPTVQNANAAGISSAAQTMATLQAAQGMAQSQAQTDLLAAQAKKTLSETLTNDMVTARAAAELRSADAKGDVDMESSTADILRRRAESLGAQSAAQIKSRTVAEQVEKIRADSRRSTGTVDYDISKSETESVHNRLDLTRARNEEKFQGELGTLPKYLQLMLEVLRGSASARRAR